MSARYRPFTQATLTLSALFALAVAPRLWGLERFATLDEYLWIDRARHFLRALGALDFASTFQTGHPGVTTMWSGAAGLWAYGWWQGWWPGAQFTYFLDTLTWQNQPADLLPAMRMGLVLATVATIPIIFLLTRPLDGTSAALVAALLVALDPWLLGHSRILHHDALAAYAMLVAVLALVNYLLVKPTPRVLLLSGVAAGIAILTKDLALAVVLWAACVWALAVLRRRQDAGQLLRAAVLWGMAVMATIVLLWPALWLDPVNTVARITQMLGIYAQNPHATGQFWPVGSTAEPGLLFYPLALLYITSPLVLVGVLAWCACAWRHRSDRASDACAYHAGLLLLLFACLYLLLITLGAKKHVRYLLPAVAALDVVAGLGLVAGARWVRQRLHLARSSWHTPVIGGALALVLLLQLAPEFPYFYTYYSPLLGGHQAASQALLLGAGEGLEVAAAYLNEIEDAASLHVVASLPNVFAPFFRGRTMTWQPDTAAFAADYVVIYRYQAQVGTPNRMYIDFVAENWPLVHTVALAGVPYAWVYQAPSADWVNGLTRNGDETGLPAAPPGLLAVKLPEEDGDVFTVYRYADRCPAWQVRTRRDGGSWQVAQTLTASSPITAPAIVQASYDLGPAAPPAAEASTAWLEIELGVAAASCNEIKWWRVPVTVFKPE